MSIRPIDVVMMPPKSQEVSNQQQGDSHRLVHAQEQANVHFNKEIKHNTKKTVETKKNQKQDKKFDAKEKGNGTYSQQRRKQQGDQKETEKESVIKRGNFDITI